MCRPPLWFEGPLVVGDSGRSVSVVRRKLGLPPGVFDGELAVAVRGFQRGAQLPMTGMVDEETATALGEREGFGLLPPWWDGTEFGEGDPLWVHVEDALALSEAFTDDLRRFQGNWHLPPTGRVSESTARLLYGLQD